MAYYMIHACLEREWYVRDYLIPSMLEQGIEENRITVHLDSEKKGCLESCMEAFSRSDRGGGMWHLQDDVLISSVFKEVTEEYDYGIACGMATKYDRRRRIITGRTNISGMWYSFPCIRIPNEIAQGCAKWYWSDIANNPVYHYAKDKKHDDEILRLYVEAYHKNVVVNNISPNIVDHVDYLIGGSIVNSTRVEEVHSLYFNEPELVEKLRMDLPDRQ